MSERRATDAGPIHGPGIAVGLAVGIIVGVATFRAPQRPLVVRAANSEPTPAEITEARKELKAARAALAEGSANAARLRLVRCIELADLSECHLRLGSIEGMAASPFAAVHLRKGIATSSIAEIRSAYEFVVTEPSQP